MFRWGVLSTAKIGREHVLPAIAEAQNGVLTAVASRDGAAARALADRFGAPHSFDSYEALLASDVVDGVYIPLPNHLHVDWSIKAAEAGKHVLCEKPIGLNSGDIERLRAAEARTGMRIAEAFMVAYHPQWAKVRALIAEGAIGPLRHVAGMFTYRNMDPANIRNAYAEGGGGLLDIGVYPTVTTLLATGQDPLCARARIVRSAEFETDIYANASLEFDGFDLTYYCATQMALRQSMLFHGETGVIEMETPFNAGEYGHAVVTLTRDKREQAEQFRFPGVRQYTRMVETFAEGAQTGDGLFTLADSARVMRAIDMVFAAGAEET